MGVDDFKFINGDCLVELKTLPDNSIDLCLSDLPYESNYKFDWDKGINLEKLWPELERIMKDDGVVVLTGQQPFTSHLVNSNLEWFRYEWIWDKQIPKGMHRAKQQPMRRHENVLVFSKNYTHNYYPIKVPRDKPVTSYNITKNNRGGIGSYVDNDKTFTYTDKNPVSIIPGCYEANSNKKYVRYHPTQKPVSLMEYLVKTYTKEGDTVLDVCYGSCSTGVACKNTNRMFIGIELDETYYEMGKERVIGS
jgi:site-specific DNA-methyltransferase (adenine-specific)